MTIAMGVLIIFHWNCGYPSFRHAQVSIVLPCLGPIGSNFGTACVGCQFLILQARRAKGSAKYKHGSVQDFGYQAKRHLFWADLINFLSLSLSHDLFFARDLLLGSPCWYEALLKSRSHRVHHDVFQDPLPLSTKQNPDGMYIYIYVCIYIYIYVNGTYLWCSSSVLVVGSIWYKIIFGTVRWYQNIGQYVPWFFQNINPK